MHILLVEDNEGDIILLTELLEERKFVDKVSVAKNGQAGIDFVQHSIRERDCPDLVLLDINLPLKSGFEVLEELKTSKETCKIPIIMLTSSCAPADINRCYSNYANLYLTKPSQMGELEDAIDAIESLWTQIIQLPS